MARRRLRHVSTATRALGLMARSAQCRSYLPLDHHSPRRHVSLCGPVLARSLLFMSGVAVTRTLRQGCGESRTRARVPAGLGAQSLGFPAASTTCRVVERVT